MLPSTIALKIDVDTHVGTRDGVPRLVDMLKRRRIPATFLFSLGPDNTGKAIRRVFRRGFLKKVSRTNVTKLYGWRTLLSGTLLPAPHIGRRNESVLRAVADAGFEVGIHCYDHFKWQDYVHRFSLLRTRREFSLASCEFERIFKKAPLGAGAPGWQANERSLLVYDERSLLYGSDTRGQVPFQPSIGGVVFDTPQLPTTLPTLDELIGRDAFPESSIPDYYAQLLDPTTPNVMTIHAEIEGQSKAKLFGKILDTMEAKKYQFCSLAAIGQAINSRRISLPICELSSGTVDGRSGLLSCQGAEIGSTLRQ